MKNTIIDIFGWIGSILLIVAYVQNSRNIITAQSSSYQFLNISGSILLVVNTLYYGAYPSGAVNIIWVFIGINYLIKNNRDAEIY